MKILVFIIALFAYSSLYSLEYTDKTPNLFIDCNGCDENFFREKIKFVNFVRDRADADIYVMLNYQMTGSGGKKYFLDFVGYNQFNGLNDTIVYTIPNSTTEDFRRNKITEKINLGLVRYLMKTQFADSLNLNFATNTTESEKKKEINDPWDYWVFSADLNSYFSGEKTSNSLSAYSSLSADRVTDDWKFSLGLNFNYSESNYLYDDINYLTLTKSRSADASAIKSLGNNFSAGVWSSYSQSTYSNILNSINASVGGEYSILPYSESNRAAIKLQYKVSNRYYQYEEETIYLKSSEYVLSNNLSFLSNFKQNWGNIYASVSWSNFLNDFDKNRFDAYTNFSVNLFKGFNLNFNLYYSSIHDQISLRRAGTSVEDLLLKRKQLGTQYSYGGSFGVSYSFGSMYSNFVNTRF
jgi:hypothetical protein